MAGIIANNYGSFNVVFEKGDGAILTDVNKKEYIDFVSGIGVNCLGHNHPKLTKALTEQITKQIHISNYYNSDVGLAFADELTKATGFDGVFFGNSGAEANEAAIKIARKYGQMKDPSGKRKVIVTLERSFHGRTIATLRATGQEKFHADSFAPYPEGFKHIVANDFDALKTAFDDTVCALMIEAVQGEGGVNLLSQDWAKAACDAAHNAGAIVIVDEVQTGMGRTGTILASSGMNLDVDVVSTAKGIAGGVPMGACLYKGRAKDVFVAGDHQSTFGGNPLACCAGRVVLSELQSKGFLENVTAVGEFIKNEIKSWNLPIVTDVRGKGLMIGIDVTVAPGDVQKKCLEMGLCCSTAGTKTVRFLPPLILTKEVASKGLEIFKSVLMTF